MSRFEAQVSAWARKAQARTDAVVKTAAAKVFEVAQTPRARGGRMPVDTAFLRATGSAALNRLPAGPSRPGEGNPGDWEASVTLTIAGMRAGDTIYMGWTAVYARKMEERYGFMKGAAAQWQSIVAQSAAEVKARVR